MASLLSLLDCPAPVRQKVYTYLLAPHPDDSETVINYALRWNWLENPSNTTFGGVPQIDLCRCPRQKPRTGNSKTKDHMYTRYKCHGPEVKFKNGREDLWVPSQAYANSGPINFLRPAREEELSRRPNANITRTCKAIYKEALPILYRGRNFLFVTGPCPRGRYQAYAAQKFFARLSIIARAHITACSLTILPHEEDCRKEDVIPSYGHLGAWVQGNLPSFEMLGIKLWNSHLADTVKIFENLFQRDGVVIELERGQQDGWVEEIEDAESFRAALLAESHRKEQVRKNVAREEVESGKLPSEERVVDVTHRPISLLGKWRGKEESMAEASSEDDGSEDEWSDAELAPSSSNKKVGDSWEIV